METFKLKDFIGGWMIGNFTPAIINSKEVEVAVKRYKANDHENPHLHKIADEITIIIDGKVTMNGITLEKDAIILIKAGETTDFTALTDSTTCVIKLPSIIGDKYTV